MKNVNRCGGSANIAPEDFFPTTTPWTGETVHQTYLPSPKEIYARAAELRLMREGRLLPECVWTGDEADKESTGTIIQ